MDLVFHMRQCVHRFVLCINNVLLSRWKKEEDCDRIERQKGKWLACSDHAKFHNKNAHVFGVLGIQKLLIVKKGTRHIYRSFMNLYLAYNSGLHHDMLLFKQITKAILLYVFQSCLNLLLFFHLLCSTLLMCRTNLCTRCLI